MTLGHLIAFERIRLVRRDLVATMFALLALILGREALAMSSLAQIASESGPDLPPEALAAQAELIASYAGSAAIGTVVFDSLPVLLFAAGLFTCWTLGAEFSGGTIRTTLVIAPSRAAFVMARVFGASLLAEGCLGLLVVVGLTAPLVGRAVGLDVPSGDGLLDGEVLSFLATAAIVVLLAVALATVLVVQLGSPLPSLAAFAVTLTALSMVGQVGLPGDIARMSPHGVILRTLASTAPAGTIVPSFGGLTTFGSPPSTTVDLAIIVASIAVLLLLSTVILMRRDITE